MFGTLKGFAKFLFDSPSREKSKSDLFQDISKNSNSRTSDQTVKKFRLDLGNEVITKVSIAEKSFIAYC